MKKLLESILILLFFTSCQQKEKINTMNVLNHENRKARITALDSLKHGKTYLPLYSHIYHIHEQRSYDLTVTISMRNISLTDSVYILSAQYFNTEGLKLRDYIPDPVFLKPLETIEIVISEADTAGGSGAKFIFDWAVLDDKNPPLFEAVMISTYGQQGLSFSTRGVNIVE